MAGTRIPKDLYEERVQQCYTRRFENKEAYTVKDWLAYCKEHYPEKSQQQHTKMWSDAGDLHTQAWKERLNHMLGPATERINELLQSDNPNDHKEAIKMVFKYSGNEIQKVEANVMGNITLTFGDE